MFVTLELLVAVMVVALPPLVLALVVLDAPATAVASNTILLRGRGELGLKRCTDNVLSA